MKGKTREQVESTISGFEGLNIFLALILFLSALCSVFTFIFGYTDACINSAFACVVAIVLINIVSRLIISLKKDLLFYPEPPKFKSKYEEHLDRSLKATNDAKDQVKRNMDSRAN